MIQKYFDNFEEMLPLYYMNSDVSRGNKLQTHYSVPPVTKGLKYMRVC